MNALNVVKNFGTTPTFYRHKSSKHPGETSPKKKW